MNKPVFLRQLVTAIQQFVHFLVSPKSLTVKQHLRFSIEQEDMEDMEVCFDDEEIYYQSNSEFRNYEVVRSLLQGVARGERNFSGINLICAPMSGVNLPDIDLSQSLLYAIDLQGSNLTGTDFQGANLREANLCGANLSYADLRGADLSNANLSHAVLVGAKLYGAFITGANLSRANLRDTLLD